MTMPVGTLTLGMNSPLVTPAMPNFRLPAWPPPRDFPIVIDARAQVVSRYGDPTWNLWPWAKRSVILNFGVGSTHKRSPRLSLENAELLKLVTAWWMFGPKPVSEPSTLDTRFGNIRALFALCSEKGIVASDLSQYPDVADELPKRIARSQYAEVLSHLHRLYEARDRLGFVLLDREGMSRLEAALPDYERRQTPYIPPRIWNYQAGRLRAFLDDFTAHQSRLEDCFRYCLDAYAHNAGSLAAACSRELSISRRPFSQSQSAGPRSGMRYLTSFSEVAKRFGVDDLLERWVLNPDESLDTSGKSVRMLAKYFSMAGYVGVAYLLNFSLMRIEEAWTLRADCLEVERDERFGPIYLLQGGTTKTVKDNNAKWITAPSAQIAVKVMSCVARLRMVAAEAHPGVPTSPEDVRNPYLVLRAYEPWSNTKTITRDLSVRPIHTAYTSVIAAYPKLFDASELLITEEDLTIARQISPTLDADVFSVGRIWPLAWHQLRRTGAVNMQASGLVSDASLQYQLKHISRAMSLYYGQGYSRIRLNNDAQNEYIRTMYEVLGKQVAKILSNRFVSPYGSKRKVEIVKLVELGDHKRLTAAAKAGTVSWRETVLGICTKCGPCPFGGIDNIARCAGGDGQEPCADALFDHEKESAIRLLGQVIDSRLVDAPLGSPYRESLEAQKRSTVRALDVLA